MGFKSLRRQAVAMSRSCSLGHDFDVEAAHPRPLGGQTLVGSGGLDLRVGNAEVVGDTAPLESVDFDLGADGDRARHVAVSHMVKAPGSDALPVFGLEGVLGR